MTLESGKVATGDTIQAADYNKLRNDLLDNHTHESGQGGTVDHKDLTETDDMSGMGHRHDDIDVHLLGSGPGANSIDNPGGNQGVHGLAASSYVAGALNNQWIIDAGTSSGQTNVQVSFTTAFDSAPYVTVAILASSGTPGDMGVRVHDVSASGFYWTASTSITLNWIAVGTKT